MTENAGDGLVPTCPSLWPSISSPWQANVVMLIYLKQAAVFSSPEEIAKFIESKCRVLECAADQSANRDILRWIKAEFRAERRFKKLWCERWQSRPAKHSMMNLAGHVPNSAAVS